MIDCEVEIASGSGGFALHAEGHDSFSVTPERSGWVVAGSERLDGARLTRAASGGFVLCTADGAEAGRTSRLTPEDPVGGTSYILLDDGRLFRIARRGPGETGLDLCGWETPGAYLTARPEGAGWRIAPTAAGHELPTNDVLPILFAAELLDAERGL